VKDKAVAQQAFEANDLDTQNRGGTDKNFKKQNLKKKNEAGIS
jgi:hypothetical protein